MRVSAAVKSRVKGSLQSLAKWPSRPHLEHFMLSQEADAASKVAADDGAGLTSCGFSATFPVVGPLNLSSRAEKRFMWIIAMANTGDASGVD